MLHFSETNRLRFAFKHNFRPRPCYVFSMLKLNCPRSYIENRKRFTLPNQAPLTNRWRFLYYRNWGRFKIEHGFRTLKTEDNCNKWHILKSNTVVTHTKPKTSFFFLSCGIWTANLWICLPLPLPLDHESNGCKTSHTCFNYQFFTPSPPHIDFNLFIKYWYM